jgi:hypothetical protein
MTYDEINDLVITLIPKGITFSIGEENGGLRLITMTRSDGVTRGTYVAPAEGITSVKTGITHLIEGVGGKPRKEEEE